MGLLYDVDLPPEWCSGPRASVHSLRGRAECVPDVRYVGFECFTEYNPIFV